MAEVDESLVDKARQEMAKVTEPKGDIASKLEVLTDDFSGDEQPAGSTEAIPGSRDAADAGVSIDKESLDAAVLANAEEAVESDKATKPDPQQWDPDRQRANEEAAELRKDNAALLERVTKLETLQAGGAEEPAAAADAIVVPDDIEEIPFNPDDYRANDLDTEEQAAEKHNKLLDYMSARNDRTIKLRERSAMQAAASASSKAIQNAYGPALKQAGLGEDSRNTLIERAVAEFLERGYDMTGRRIPEALGENIIQKHALLLATEKEGGTGGAEAPRTDTGRAGRQRVPAEAKSGPPPRPALGRNKDSNKYVHERIELLRQSGHIR